MRRRPPRCRRSDGMLARLDRAAGQMNPFLAMVAIGLLVLNVITFALMAPYFSRRGVGAAISVGSAFAVPSARLAGLQ